MKSFQKLCLPEEFDQKSPEIASFTIGFLVLSIFPAQEYLSHVDHKLSFIAENYVRSWFDFTNLDMIDESLLDLYQPWGP